MAYDGLLVQVGRGLAEIPVDSVTRAFTLILGNSLGDHQPQFVFLGSCYDVNCRSSLRHEIRPI
jgi:hypothetical protein